MKTFPLKFTEGQHQTLKDMAAKKGKSLNGYIMSLLFSDVVGEVYPEPGLLCVACQKLQEKVKYECDSGTANAVPCATIALPEATRRWSGNGKSYP